MSSGMFWANLGPTFEFCVRNRVGGWFRSAFHRFLTQSIDDTAYPEATMTLCQASTRMLPLFTPIRMGFR